MPENYELFKNNDVDLIFGKEIVSLFHTADYRICNLEGCFTNDDATPKLKDGPNIKAPCDFLHTSPEEYLLSRFLLLESINSGL